MPFDITAVPYTAAGLLEDAFAETHDWFGNSCASSVATITDACRQVGRQGAVGL